MTKLSKLIGVAVVMAAGIAGNANAVPTFTVDPTALGSCPVVNLPPLTCQPFTASFIEGNSSELLTVLNASDVSGQGYVQFTGFSNNGTAVNNFTTGVNSFYGLYLTFTLTDHLVSGTIGQPGSTYALDSLDYQVFFDPGNHDVFTPANAPTAQMATVTDTGSNDIQLGSGSLISGTAAFGATGGVSLNSQETITLTSNGSLYFTSPVPFFTIAFTEFNNTQQGPTPGGPAHPNLISIQSASGGVDFNRAPEPGSIALLGVGLLALARARSRRSNS